MYVKLIRKKGAFLVGDVVSVPSEPHTSLSHYSILLLSFLPNNNKSLRRVNPNEKHVLFYCFEDSRKIGRQKVII